MSKTIRVLVMVGFVFASKMIAPHLLPAAPPPGGSALSDAQQAVLTTALAEKKPYAEIVDLAVKAGMDVGEVVFFLCQNSDNDPAQAYEIVYAAISGGNDAEKVVAGALRAGAQLKAVVQAARAAGASREAIAAAAAQKGFPPHLISNAFAGAPAGVPFGGGAGGGSLSSGPGAGGPIGGDAGGGNASPSKP